MLMHLTGLITVAKSLYLQFTIFSQFSFFFIVLRFFVCFLNK